MNGAFNDYLKMFDIFCITESKVNKGTYINNYTVFNLENKPKNYPLPGIHGIQVYIADHLAGHCSQIIVESPMCDSILWIKVSEKLILGTLYTPNQSSKYYCSEFFDNLSLDISIIKGDYDLPIMLIGDFNSWTGTLN